LGCVGRVSRQVLIETRSQALSALAPGAVPPGYWTNVGVVLNLTIAVIALLLAAHFLLATP